MEIRDSVLGVLGVLGGVLVGASATAQPMLVTYWTPEAKVAGAQLVFVGTLAKVQSTVIVPAGGRTKRGSIDPNGCVEHAITVKVDEVLKGELQGEIGYLRVETLAADKRHDEWSKAATPCLWFLGPTPKSGERRSWEMLPLGPRVPAESGWGRRIGPPMFSMDFTVLEDEKGILACARAFARTSKEILPVHLIRIPPVVSRQCGSGDNPWNHLIVPVGPSLEARAKRLIASPQEFVPKGETLDPPGRYQLRFGGVDALRYFKSEANVELLRSLLADCLDDPVSGHYWPAYPIRVRAFEILLHWGVSSQLPKSPEKITRLQLTDTEVTDAGLKLVAGLENLETLELQGTKVSDLGVKELAGMRSLVCLDLQETRVTDAGLMELAGLKNLTRVRLHRTRVTDLGIARLRHALPQCQVEQIPSR